MKTEYVREHLITIRKRLNILAEPYRLDDAYVALVGAFHDFVDKTGLDIH